MRNAKKREKCEQCSTPKVAHLSASPDNFFAAIENDTPWASDAAQQANEAMEVTGTWKDAEELEAWLLSLDLGKGTMIRYKQALLEQFDDMYQLSATVVFAEAASGSLINRVDPCVFEILGNDIPLGHKFLLAKGLVALSEK